MVLIFSCICSTWVNFYGLFDCFFVFFSCKMCKCVLCCFFPTGNMTMGCLAFLLRNAVDIVKFTLCMFTRQELNLSGSCFVISLCFMFSIIVGRDGLTHNMLNDIHNHWKHAEAVRIKCMGVPTVDMKNICTQMKVFFRWHITILR